MWLILVLDACAGKVLAIGQEGGALSLLDMETGDITHLSSGQHKTSITSLYWACEQKGPTKTKTGAGYQISDRTAKLLQLPTAFVADDQSSHFASSSSGQSQQSAKTGQRDLGRIQDVLLGAEKGMAGGVPPPAPH